jgi:hypothetical protein
VSRELTYDSASRRLNPPTGTIRVPAFAVACVMVSSPAVRLVVMTTRPADPMGHRSARSAVSRRSSMISAHGRRVCPSQATKRVAATCALSVRLAASTVFAACANEVMTASRLDAVTHTRISTVLAFHSACVYSTASWVLPVPASLSSGWVRITVSPARSVIARSGPDSVRT